MIPILEAARQLGAAVGPVLPVNGKIPMWKQWPTSATRTPNGDPEWSRATGAGLVTGSTAGYFVLDVDAAKGGLETLAAWEREHGELPTTWTSNTGGGGRHFFFLWPDFVVRGNAGKLGVGIDVRGDGGFVVAPPSRHSSGTSYAWADGCSPWEVKLAEAPAWLLDMVRPQPERWYPIRTVSHINPDAAYKRARAYLAKIPGGLSGSGGHDQTWKAALVVVRGFALGEERGFDLLASEYNPRCDPPWSERELRHKVEGAARDASVPWGYLLDAPAHEASEPAEVHDEGTEEDAVDGTRKPRQSKAAALLQLAAECELFLDERDEAHAAIPLPSGGRRIVRVTSTFFKGWLTSRYFAKTEEVVGRDARDNAIHLLEAQSAQRGVRHELHERFARTPDGAVWIDIGDDTWRAVKITADGWSVETSTPILFRRYEHMKALPAPEPGGKLVDLFRFVNVSDEGDRLLVLAWMVAAVFDGLPRPILDFSGVKGSAKTTAARAIRSLLDPSVTEVLRPLRSEDELVHQLGHHAVAAYDNLSSVADWLADALCRAVTGAASEKRRLFTDGESVLVAYKRAIILTGINTPSAAPDLLDRTIQIELQPVPPARRREESEFWSEFNAERPRLFGALLQAICDTLNWMPKMQLPELQRMADFTRIGAAAVEALGLGHQNIDAAYQRSATRQTTEVLEADCVAVAIRQLVDRQGDFDGTVGGLHEELRKLVPDEKWNGFPKNSSSLGKRLRVLMPSLKEIGVEVRPYDGERNSRRITIRGKPR